MAGPSPAPAPSDWVRKIHFSFFFLDDTMPQSIADHIDSVREKNPGFEVTVWGPKEARALLEAQYPQFVQKFDNFPHAIQKSDFSRYAILHAHGGVYADIDYVLKQPFENIFEFINSTYKGKTAFVNETPNGLFLRRLSNSMMASRQPGHPFWMHVMQQAGNGKGLSPHQQVLTGTGPQLIDKAYATYKSKKTHPVGVLSKKYFSPCSICSRGDSCGKPKYVLAYHKADGCWNTNSTAFYNTMYCNMSWILFSFLLLIIIIVLIVLLCKSSRNY